MLWYMNGLLAYAARAADPEDDQDLDSEHEQPRLDRGAPGGDDDLRLDVEAGPLREPALVPALAAAAVPDGEGDRHEAPLREGDAAHPAQAPLEDHRPLAAVVGGDGGHVGGVGRGDRRAPLRGVLVGLAAGEIDEPEVHAVRRVAEDE